MPASGLAEIEKAGQLEVRTVASTYLVSLQAAELRLKLFARRRGELL